MFHCLLYMIKMYEDMAIYLKHYPIQVKIQPKRAYTKQLHCRSVLYSSIESHYCSIILNISTYWVFSLQF